MQGLADFWAAYQSTVGFAIVNAFFALSTYAVLSAGILSFATVTYAAFGGFIGAQVMLQAGIDPVVALPAAAAAGALLAYVIALIFLRLESHWMALASLALILITRVVVVNAPKVTGGVNGLSLPVSLPFALLALLLVVVMIVFYRLSVSWFGIAARAVREDPAVASSLGIAPRRIHTIAFVISGAVGGLGGMLLALVLQFLSPSPPSRPGAREGDGLDPSRGDAQAGGDRRVFAHRLGGDAVPGRRKPVEHDDRPDQQQRQCANGTPAGRLRPLTPPVMLRRVDDDHPVIRIGARLASAIQWLSRRRKIKAITCASALPPPRPPAGRPPDRCRPAAPLGRPRSRRSLHRLRWRTNVPAKSTA